MIINKSAFERGFGHGTVYTAETIDLDDAGEEGEWFYFSNPETPKGQRTCPTLDAHGLPYIGQRIEQFLEQRQLDEPLICTSALRGRHRSRRLPQRSL